MACVPGSLCTMLSLQWEPEIIAVAVMYLAGRLCKFDIQEWTAKQSSRRWWEQFVQDVPVELLEGASLEATSFPALFSDIIFFRFAMSKNKHVFFFSFRHLPPDPGLVFSGKQAHLSADAGERAGPCSPCPCSSSPPGTATSRQPSSPAAKEDVSSGREPCTATQTLSCEFTFFPFPTCVCSLYADISVQDTSDSEVFSCIFISFPFFFFFFRHPRKMNQRLQVRINNFLS